jgi:pimeloyl-ACP methyl ester carboxylesterase
MNAAPTTIHSPRPSFSGGDARARMLAGLPLGERRLAVAGVSTVVLEGGSARPLILLHGGIECGAAIWAPVAQALTESHRVIVPDLPGLGESEPVGRLDAAAFADWLRALIEMTCEEPPELVAHSLTGGLAARFAARHGDLLRKLVIYAAPGIGPYRIPLGLRVVAMRFGLRPTERNAERFDRFAFFDFDGARRRDPAWFEAFSAYTRQRATVPQVKRTMGRLLKAGAKHVPDSDLRSIEVPTTLIWGRQDRFVPVALAEAASSRLAWPLQSIEHAGHVPHIERPGAFLHALETANDGEPRS